MTGLTCRNKAPFSNFSGVAIVGTEPDLSDEQSFVSVNIFVNFLRFSKFRVRVFFA